MSDDSTVDTERDILEHGSARPDSPGGRVGDGMSQQGTAAAGKGAPEEEPAPDEDARES